MAKNITPLIKGFSIDRGIDDLISAGSFVMSNADGSYIGDWTGDVEIDRLIKISTGYQAGGDALALFLTGLVSGVADTTAAADFKEEVTVTLMTLLKNFRKTKVTTGYFTAGQTGQQILEALVTTYMPGVTYDFTACAGTTFVRFRVEGEVLSDALQEIAIAAGCELFWDLGGVLTATPFVDPYGAPDHVYGLEDYANFTKGNNLDILATNKLTIRGRKKALPELPNETLATQVFAKELFGVAGADVIRQTLTVKFNAGRATGISIASSDATYFTYALIDVTEGTCQIMATRILTGALPTDVTITVSGTKYSDDDSQFYIETDVQDANLLALFGGAPMMGTYENPYIQTDADAETIGTYLLLINYLSMIPGSFLAPHNKALKPNDILTLTTLTGDVQFVVRKIATDFNAGDYSLTDTVEGWCVPAEPGT